MAKIGSDVTLSTLSNYKRQRTENRRQIDNSECSLLSSILCLLSSVLCKEDVKAKEYAEIR